MTDYKDRPRFYAKIPSKPEMVLDCLITFGIGLILAYAFVYGVNIYIDYRQSF